MSGRRERSSRDAGRGRDSRDSRDTYGTTRSSRDPGRGRDSKDSRDSRDSRDTYGTTRSTRPDDYSRQPTSQTTRSSRHDDYGRQPTSHSSSGRSHAGETAYGRSDGSHHASSHGGPSSHSYSSYSGGSGSTAYGGYGSGKNDDSVGSSSTSGYDPGDNGGDNPVRRSGRNQKTSDRKRGEGPNSLYVLIYPNGSGRNCGHNAVTTLGSHWALYRGPPDGLGTRTDIILDISGTGNDSTNIMSHSGRPEVSNRPGYSLAQSTNHPVPYYVSDAVSSQALAAACRRALEGFQYNAITNNCQTFILNVLRALAQNGHITQQEYNDIYSRISSRFAPAHY